MRIKVKESASLIELLQEKLDSATRSRLKKMLTHGAVRVNGTVTTRPDTVLTPGQCVEILHIGPEGRVTAPFPILFEDRWLIAVNKPEGLLSISTQTAYEHTAYRKVNKYVEEVTQGRGRVFVVHRLDREVSGILLFAKTLAVKKALQANWKTAEKLYAALVEGRPPARQGTVRGYLKEGKDLKVYPVERGEDGRLCITHYKVLEERSRHTLLEIRLETGRKNQIRAHMTQLGCPIVGDEKYGAKEGHLRRVALHAFQLTVTHPITGNRLTINCPFASAFRKRYR